MSGKYLRDISCIDQLELSGKNTFIRVDFNVPMVGGKITDDKRIQAALPTIKYALDKGAKVILASHLGRPKGEYKKEFSLETVAQHLGELLGIEVILIEEASSDAPKGLLHSLKPTQVLLLENLRFDDRETKNEASLVNRWLEYVDVYINDAFGASHRAHASIVGLPNQLETPHGTEGPIENKAMGFLVQKEIEILSKMVSEPQKPFWAIMGGAKVSDKIKVIESLIDLVDGIVIGGAMAYTFLKAQGLSVGKSLVEKGQLNYAKDLMERMQARDKKLLLPVDHVVVESLDEAAEVRTTSSAAIDEGWMGVDVGPQTREAIAQELVQSGSVFWNGPMGIFEREEFSKGTFFVAETLSHLDAFTIVGGGDSAAAAKVSGFADKMDHISTGGGASLEFLQGDSLPGLEVLRKKKR